eukprot:gene3896-4440_t
MVAFQLDRIVTIIETTSTSPILVPCYHDFLLFIVFNFKILISLFTDDLPEAGSGKNPEKRVIFPGTLWCGMGNKAENDEQLGTYADLDSCCRSHDKCDRKVNAFSKDYGYRNWRPFTVNDCDCDSEFYSCLKDAKEHKKAAKIVGKIFFNILSMPCLRFNAFGTKATKGHSPSFK